MELLLSKIKEKKSRAFMILCDIYLFIVIIIIRQLFKTHQTTQEKSGEPFFFSPFLHAPPYIFSKSHQTTNNKKKEAELPKSIKSNSTIKFVVKIFFCLFYIYIFSITFSISYTTLSRRNHTSYLINIIIT